MNVTETSKALVRLCRSAIRKVPFDVDGVSLVDLRSMAYRHGLDGSFYYVLNDAVADKESIEEFYKAHQRLRLITIRQDSARVRLLSLLEKEHIHALPLKGEGVRAYYSEDFARPSLRLHIFVEKEKAERVGEMLIAQGFSELERTPTYTTYRQEPYLLLSIHTALADESCPNRIFFDEMLMRSPLQDGKKYIHKMTSEDMYIFLLEYAYEHLMRLGASIRTVLDLGVLYEHLKEQIHTKEMKKTLARLDLLRFSEVMYKIYKSWMDDETLDGSLAVLSDLILAKGFYGTFENYLKNSYASRSRLSGIFLPYSTLRVAEPWCVSPLLYPVATVARAVHVLFPKEDLSDDVTLPHLARGLTEKECYAIWRAVKVRVKRQL